MIQYRYTLDQANAVRERRVWKRTRSTAIALVVLLGTVLVTRPTGGKS